TLLLVWTNKYHHLVFASVIYRVSNGFTQPEILHGSWYYVNLGYSYLVITLGVVALVSGFLRSHPSTKRQYFVILVAAIIPWVGNIVGEFFLADFSFDITPLGFGLSAVLFAYSAFRDRFMD